MKTHLYLFPGEALKVDVEIDFKTLPPWLLFVPATHADVPKEFVSIVSGYILKPT